MMKKESYDILQYLLENSFCNSRALSDKCGYSLDITNKILLSLQEIDYIDKQMQPTPKAWYLYKKNIPKRAIILAAGYGLRMVPIDMEVPKAFLEVKGEKLIERIIRQLHAVNIHEIYIVVGFMKEKFEYLIDEFGVQLIVNPEYATKNNIYSLNHASQYLGDSYIVPCDIWCADNPFSNHEMYSWYMVSDNKSMDSDVRLNRKMELVKIGKKEIGNSMIGISYLIMRDVESLKDKLKKFCINEDYRNSFWEEILYIKNKSKVCMCVYPRIIPKNKIAEINTYEQLRDIDINSEQLNSLAIKTICNILSVSNKNIINIKVLKKGMTNRSFLFECNQKKYIMRIPGEGTDQLINRQEESDVYNAIKKYGISDNVAYINPKNGYKITEYFENTRVCDAYNKEDVEKCIKKLKVFHNLKLKVNHKFDVFQKIEFYEKLWEGENSVYKDYYDTKKNVMNMQYYISKYKCEEVLTHIDAVPDNFLFINDDEDIKLIDWEYAAMQDPHVDIAMFCIYALYNRQQIDDVISMYFDGKCKQEIRIKIYCYISACGLLWSNWCEYKRILGVEFGEYALRQYRYAKEYYRIAKREIEQIQGESL